MDLRLDVRNFGGYLRFRLLAFGLESVPMIRHLLLDEDYSLVQIVHYGPKSSNFLFTPLYLLQALNLSLSLGRFGGFPYP